MVLENDKSRQQCLASGRSLTVVEPRMSWSQRLGGARKVNRERKQKVESNRGGDDDQKAGTWTAKKCPS